MVEKLFEELSGMPEVEAIALAGVQAPSGLNQQPWKISVLQNKAMIDEMNDALITLKDYNIGAFLIELPEEE